MRWHRCATRWLPNPGKESCMDRFLLQRLLVDRSLGALSPDVAGLLEAWLARDADALRLACEFDRTALLARCAMPAAGHVRLPGFPRARLERAGTVLRLRRIAGRVAALAACLVLGFSLGHVVLENRERLDATTSMIQPAPQGEKAGDNSEGFWSARRVYE